MTAIDVVVRPHAATQLPEPLNALHGLFDLFVDGINLTARLTEAPQAALLVELGHALSQLNRGKRARACFPLYSAEEAWEIGLEADGVDTLLSVYRVGPSARVAIFDRRMPLSALTAAVVRALEQAEGHANSTGVGPARRALGLPYPTYAHAPLVRCKTTITPKPAAHVAFSAEIELKQRRSTTTEAPGLERADLHALLATGRFSLTVKSRTLDLASVQVFLMSERLLSVAEDVLDAWRSERAVFRRAELDGAQLSVRRGPGNGPLRVSLTGAGSSPDHEGTTLAEVPARGFVLACARFAQSLVETFERADPTQTKNLRLRALARAARGLVDMVCETQSNDSLCNPEPESYRSFGLPRPATGQGTWAHGGKMRFVPRWVATVPNIDLRATFQCGDKILVGSQRETACLLRDSGRVVWRVAASRAASVVTPFGLARLGFDGRVELHDLETGGVRFTTHIAPRAAGGATGALVNGPALPKLLVVAEGDRSVTAIDLVSGETRWRFTGARPASYRMRRAGKLLIVAGGDSALMALDVCTGDVVWRVRERLPFSGDICIDHDSAFAIAGGPIGPCKLLHVDLWSGALRWTRELEERPCTGQAPLVSAGAVIIATRDKRGVGASALARDTGAPLWEQAPGLASPTTAWLVVDDALIANTASGALLCLEARTGISRYSQVFSRHVEADQPRRLEPVLRNGALFVPQHQVHVIRPRDGEILGTLPSDLIPDLLRVDERCGAYLAEESGHVAAFSVAPRLSLVK